MDFEGLNIKYLGFSIRINVNKSMQLDHVKEKVLKKLFMSSLKLPIFGWPKICGQISHVCFVVI